ncbi:MAG: hypothetical protein ACR2IT_12440 [Pirellulales bacterium]
MTPPMAAEADQSAGSAAAAEIWLHGNVRPAAGLLLAAVLLAAGIVATTIVVPLSPWLRWPLAVAAAAGVVAAMIVAWSAARPRLVRSGSEVIVRLAPLATHRVPLEIVECVFPGSQPLVAGSQPPAGDEPAANAAADRRVNTLVIRLAERALAWRSRPVASVWGAWSEGSIVFDGRWCEPLSPAVVRGISARLLEAKRQVASGAMPSSGAPQ